MIRLITRLPLAKLSAPAAMRCIYLLNFYLKTKLIRISVPSSCWCGWESLQDQRRGRYPRSVRPWGMSARCSFLQLTGAPLSLWQPSSKSVLCSYWNSPCTRLCRLSKIVHSGRFDLWLSSVGCARFLLDDGQTRFRIVWGDGRLLLKCWRYMKLHMLGLATIVPAGRFSSVFLPNELW